MVHYMIRTFWEITCTATPVLRFLFTAAVVLVVVTLIAVPGVQTGSETYYIVIANLVILTPLLIASGATIWYCSRRDPLEDARS